MYQCEDVVQLCLLLMVLPNKMCACGGGVALLFMELKPSPAYIKVLSFNRRVLAGRSDFDVLISHTLHKCFSELMFLVVFDRSDFCQSWHFPFL